MIFAKTIDLVLSGRKSQTLRPAYAGDYLASDTGGSLGVWTCGGDPRYALSHRPRWIVGRTMAVQRARCRPAEGRVLVTGLAEVLNPLAVDAAFADREGLDSLDDFLRIWHELHGRNPVQRCWAIGFRLWTPEADPVIRLDQELFAPAGAGGGR